MNVYEKLKQEINKLKKSTSWFNIGKTTLNKPIVCFKLGSNSGKKIILQAGIHAREYISSFFLIELIKYLKAFEFYGQIYVVPLVNPDGVDICINGTKNILKKNKKNFVKNLLKYQNKKLYKANANGVDLNTNFDADWGKGKQNNLFYPSSENFVGFKPNSENETKALINLTKEINPFLTLSYHTKGEEIYFGFSGQSDDTKINQKRYMSFLRDKTSYKLTKTKNSSGGYKDYCLLKLNIVSFTIELANDNLSHPVGLKHLKEIFLKHKDTILPLFKL